jgi:hypothetical protein
MSSSEWRTVKETLSELRQSIDFLMEHLEDDEATDNEIEASISNLVEIYMPHAAAMFGRDLVQRDGQSVVLVWCDECHGEHLPPVHHRKSEPGWVGI